MVGSNPLIAAKRFAKAIVLPSPVHNVCEEIGASIAENNVLESLRESRFGSFLRLLSSYIIFGRWQKLLPAFHCSSMSSGNPRVALR
jgi:hypothetical protein